VELLRSAALVHDLGRVVVPSSVWDRPGPLGTVDVERDRLDPSWTHRVLVRSPATAPWAQLASGHHERLDGRGDHRLLGSRGRHGKGCGIRRR